MAGKKKKKRYVFKAFEAESLEDLTAQLNADPENWEGVEIFHHRDDFFDSFTALVSKSVSINKKRREMKKWNPKRMNSNMKA